MSIKNQKNDTSKKQVNTAQGSIGTVKFKKNPGESKGPGSCGGAFKLGENAKLSS